MAVLLQTLAELLAIQHRLMVGSGPGHQVMRPQHRRPQQELAARVGMAT